MAFGTSLHGTGYRGISVPNKTPQQMDLFNFLTGGASQGLRSGGMDFLSGLAGGDPSQFAQMEAPALRQFGQLQGNIGSRFSGIGSGAQRSSGFQNTMSGAAGDLAERLQGNRINLQQNAVNQLLGLSQSLLGQDLNENMLIPKKTPFWQDLLLGLVGGGSKIAGAKLGGGG